MFEHKTIPLQNNKKLTVINLLAGPGCGIGVFGDLDHKYIYTNGGVYDRDIKSK